jgi:glycosyltransferase involved in cell wall biosynthesis
MPRRIISLITPHYTPEITAAAHRMEAVAKTLSSSFHVHVFTLSERGTANKEQSVKLDEYLTVHYLPVVSYNKSFFPTRAFFELWYSFRLLRASGKIFSDLSIITIPFMFLLPVFASRCKSKKKIADIRDLVWYYLPGNNLFTRFLKGRLINVMHQALRKFDALTVTNAGEKDWLVRNALIKDEKIVVIENGISASKFKQLSEIRYTPHPHKFSVTYVGNVGTSQHFLSIINAVKEMSGVRLNIVGDGNNLGKLRAYVESKKIKNVFFYGKQKWYRVIPLYQASDLLYASLKDEYDTAIPSKLYEYLATGLPVLYQGSGSAVDFLSGFKNTYILKDTDSGFLEKVIWKIKKLSLNRSGVNIHIIGNRYVREKLSRQFVELSARLLNERIISDIFVEDILMDSN